MKFNLTYGKGYKEISISEDRVVGVLESKAHHFKPGASEEDIVRNALEKTISSNKLMELVKNKENVVIISSDHTRPVPSHVTMPILLEEIRKGNPNAKISILVATGMHRATTKEELIEKYGETIANNENIIIHDSCDDSSLVKIGTLPSGGELIINKYAAEADLLIAEGFIEPHFFAGFSGGRKSVLPGIASKATILANHCAEFVGSDKARTGKLKFNPIHEDMLYAAQKANLAFILNVVIDSDKKIIAAFSGNCKEAHYEGCEFVKGLAGVEAIKSDIAVVTNGGYPLDQNIYQTVKGLTAAEATLKEKGVIIMISQCSDGHGGEEFYETFRDAESVQGVMDEIMKRDRGETLSDQWEAQVLARVLLKYKVIMITEAPKKMIEDMYMTVAPDFDTALKMADEYLGHNNGKITVVPDGVSVVVRG